MIIIVNVKCFSVYSQKLIKLVDLFLDLHGDTRVILQHALLYTVDEEKCYNSLKTSRPGQ